MGSIEEQEFETIPIFRLDVPGELPGVDSILLNPLRSWAQKGQWKRYATKLADKFIENFRKYTDTEIRPETRRCRASD
jgi:phosphoenolpyruvate carboxykinase (ATP)